MVKVKLLRLQVFGLHFAYNYDVKFNNDVTFIYGANGCGKTTILNITEAIITGCLYKLFEYDFKEIVLDYMNNENESFINIRSIEKNRLETLFMGEAYTIEKIREPISSLRNEESNRKLRHLYFEKYEVLGRIHEIFNYVYLPLNRSLSYEYLNEDHRYIKNGTYGLYGRPSKNIAPERKDKSLEQVEALVYEKTYRMNAQITKINDKFRNEMLKSSLEINSSVDFQELLKEMKAYSKEEIKKIESAYINLLTELNIINEEEKDKYINYFDNIVIDMERVLNDESGVAVSLVLRYKDIMRIKELSRIAEKTEEQKAGARSSIELFLDTINSFLADNEEEKEIVIDSGGLIGFRTKYRKELISVHFLSSGERQLLIFFANLIFNVGKKKKGIFVVDEPELSLHLSWQKKFVEKTMSINPNLQLIFATHSPEFVGKYRNRMFKLEKQINK